MSIHTAVPSDPARGHGARAATVTHDVPISSIRLCKGAGRRKVSSLQDRVRVPTSSEFVANILALSSDRFTPAIDATSLMSSSSLQKRKENSNSRRHIQVTLTHRGAGNPVYTAQPSSPRGMLPPPRAVTTGGV